MPCDSRITTKLFHRARVLEAARALGLVAQEFENGSLNVDGMSLTRYAETAPFQAAGNLGCLQKLSQKYAELGVREWARKRGFTVAGNASSSVGQTLTLVRRQS